MVSVQDVSKSYGKNRGVETVSFHCPAHATVGLLGVNGAGKTTLLNILTGCMPMDKGSITVDGMDLMRYPSACRRRIGYLPERPPLYDEMTLRDYLAFVSRLREVESRGIARHVENIMELCALTEVRDRLLGHLSKGYRQRVGIAQALCGDPPLLVLDEPTVGLDPRQVVEMRSLIHLLGEDHTILFSSHILSEVQALCSRVIILHEGKVRYEGSVRDEDKGSREHARCVSLRLSVQGSEREVLSALRDTPGYRRAKALEKREEGFTECELLLDSIGQPEVALFRLLAARDLPIKRMERQSDTLEALFLRVTSGAEAE